MASGWVAGSPPTYNGVPVYDQCAVFVYNYARLEMGCPFAAIGVYDADLYAHWVWDDPRLQPANTDRIMNDGTNYPQPQDIIVWSKDLPKSGGAGHIAIVDSSSSRSNVIVVDSNWAHDEKGQIHQVSSVMGWVLGWFRKKGVGGGVLDPANIYVSLTGSDASNGSASTPFRTIQHAIDMANAGGATIYISPGSYGEKNSSNGKHIHFVSTGGAVQTGG